MNIASATEDTADRRERAEAAERILNTLTAWLRKHPACIFTTQIANRLSKTPFQLHISTTARMYTFRGSDVQDAYAQAAQVIMLEEL